MNRWRMLFLLCLLMSLSGCFSLSTVHNPEDDACNLVSRELKVVPPDQSGYQYSGNMHVNSVEEAVFLVIVIPTTSLLVSGSVAVMGNVVYWVEKQGKCTDSTVRTFTSNVQDAITEAGGSIVETSSEFLDWLKSL